jgi:hypothetical protein
MLPDEAEARAKLLELFEHEFKHMFELHQEEEDKKSDLVWQLKDSRPAVNPPRYGRDPRALSVAGKEL